MNKTRQIDRGTPASRNLETVTVEIDGLPASHRSLWQDEFAARAEQQGKIVETN